jgi:hypothetical protein
MHEIKKQYNKKSDMERYLDMTRAAGSQTLEEKYTLIRGHEQTVVNQGLMALQGLKQSNPKNEEGFWFLTKCVYRADTGPKNHGKGASALNIKETSLKRSIMDGPRDPRDIPPQLCTPSLEDLQKQLLKLEDDPV